MIYKKRVFQKGGKGVQTISKICIEPHNRYFVAHICEGSIHTPNILLSNVFSEVQKSVKNKTKSKRDLDSYPSDVL